MLARLRELFDLRDAHFYGGLVLAAAGGACLSLPWTLVAVGAVLALYAVLLPWLMPRKGE